jgi:hypothetical protein
MLIDLGTPAGASRLGTKASVCARGDMLEAKVKDLLHKRKEVRRFHHIKRPVFEPVAERLAHDCVFVRLDVMGLDIGPVERRRVEQFLDIVAIWSRI